MDFYATSKLILNCYTHMIWVCLGDLFLNIWSILLWRHYNYLEGDKRWPSWTGTVCNAKWAYLIFIWEVMPCTASLLSPNHSQSCDDRSCHSHHKGSLDWLQPLFCVSQHHKAFTQLVSFVPFVDDCWRF